MSEETDIPDDDADLAAEYVLGLLPDEEAAAFADRLQSSARLRDLCAAWEDHFADLLADSTETPPSAASWRRIEARLFKQRTPLWQRLGLGQAALGGALAAGLVLAALRFGWLDPGAEADFVATLSSEAAGQVALIAIDIDTGRLAAELTGVFPDSGRARELWLIQGEAAPVSLGILEPGVVVTLSLPEDLDAEIAGAVLAISDEPTGGSPTGLPTGAVLATGTLRAS